MDQINRISVEQTRDMLEEGSPLLLDIRDEQSFHRGHIPGATHLDSIDLRQLLEQTERSQPVIVCCYHGVSSIPAAQYIAAQGFTEVYSMDGGFELWRQHFTVSQS